MGGKEVKGFVITPAIAATITGVVLSAFLGAIGWAWSSNTKDSRETRESMIRIETMLTERTARFKEEQAEMKAALQDERTLAKLQRDNQDKQQLRFEYALKAKGIRLE